MFVETISQPVLDLREDEEEEVEKSCCDGCGDYLPVDKLFDVSEASERFTYLCLECRACQGRCYCCNQEMIINDDYESCGEYFCSRECRDQFYSCMECGGLVHEEDARWSDRADGYMCEDCYQDEDEDGSFCEPPHSTITATRVDGEVLEWTGSPDCNPSFYRVCIPSGSISAQGQMEISRLLASHGYNVPQDMLNSIEWTTDTKNGRFTHRLAKAVRIHNDQKLSKELRDIIGDTAAKHTVRYSEFGVHLTRCLNIDRDYFINGGSCWWTDYWQSRCYLKSHNGFGMLVQPPMEMVPIAFKLSCCPYTERVWVLPFLVNDNIVIEGGIFDIPEYSKARRISADNCFLMFNHYGQENQSAMPRIFSEMMGGMDFRHVCIDINSHTMYVNNNRGYLIYPLGDKRFEKVSTVELHAHPDCDCG